MNPADPLLIPSARLETWVEAAFTAAGLPAQDAALSAGLLVQTSLWGIDSHGVARVPHYLNRLSLGSIRARPELKFTRTAPATGQVDGGDGLGFVVLDFATRHAIDLARDAGVGAVGVSNSSHCGAIGLYARQITRAGQIAIVFTHSDSFVTPHGGDRAFFGTNPIAIAIPTPDPDRPFCADLATSVAPWNRIMNARRENQPVPPGLGVDRDGRDTTDPHAIVALRPAAGHKGYALAFAIDLLCGPLNGMAYGPHLAPMYAQLDRPRCLGSFVLALDPSRFAGGAALAAVVATAMAEVKTQGREVLAPGDPEYGSESRRRAEGIPVESSLLEELRHWATRLGLPTLG